MVARDFLIDKQIAKTQTEIENRIKREKELEPIHKSIFRILYSINSELQIRKSQLEWLGRQEPNDRIKWERVRVSAELLMFEQFVDMIMREYGR